LDALECSPHLFARKFDAEEDTAILSLLERHLKSSKANVYRSTVSSGRPPPAEYDLELASDRV
jgi:hypothetical protein